MRDFIFCAEVEREASHRCLPGEACAWQGKEGLDVFTYNMTSYRSNDWMDKSWLNMSISETIIETILIWWHVIFLDHYVLIFWPQLTGWCTFGYRAYGTWTAEERRLGMIWDNGWREECCRCTCEFFQVCLWSCNFTKFQFRPRQPGNPLTERVWFVQNLWATH